MTHSSDLNVKGQAVGTGSESTFFVFAYIAWSVLHRRRYCWSDALWVNHMSCWNNGRHTLIWHWIYMKMGICELAGFQRVREDAQWRKKKSTIVVCHEHPPVSVRSCFLLRALTWKNIWKPNSFAISLFQYILNMILWFCADDVGNVCTPCFLWNVKKVGAPVGGCPYIYIYIHTYI